MLENKDYAELTLEELLIAKKKVRKREILSGVLIGIAMGILVYGVVKKGIGFLHIFLPLVLISGIYRHSKKLKNDLQQIQAAITAKS